jgi:hypothetical protein
MTSGRSRTVLGLASCGILIVGAYFVHRQGDVVLRHSPSAIYERYATTRSTGAWQGTSASLPRLFDDFYVAKDGATDCSFVAALMLLLRQDPAYPLRVVSESAEGYTVRFPALRKPIEVSREDLRLHHNNWEKTRPAYNKVWRGHIPAGLEVLRTAYYNHQAEVGIRGRRGEVHNGGFPSQDLITLSGAKASFSLVAECPGSSTYEASFGSCPAQLFQTLLRRDGQSFSTVKIGRPQEGNPLRRLGNLESRLVIVTTKATVSGWLGPRFVPFHTYYYLGATPDGDYVLGDPYQTRRPIIVTPTEFMRNFLAVDFVDVRSIIEVSAGGVQ